MRPRLQGYCPMGCGETLFVASGGYITCSWEACPRPDAAADILLEGETEHIVTFDEGSFSILHPLKERLDGKLQDCDLHAVLSRHAGPPVQGGRYRAIPDEVAGSYAWIPLAVRP